MSIVLGISGPARIGKDTVADWLVSLGWVKLRFADNLKWMCAGAFDLDPKFFFDDSLKDKPLPNPLVFDFSRAYRIIEWMSKTHPHVMAMFLESLQRIQEDGTNFPCSGKVLNTPREIAQTVGTDFCRFYVDTYHIDVISAQIKPDFNFVICDVRFPNEGQFVASLPGGKVIRLEKEITTTEGFRSHSSETAMIGWEGFSAVIFNNEVGLDTLYSKVESFLKTLEEQNGSQK